MSDFSLQREGESVLNVYVASIPKDGKMGELVPKERDCEVKNCVNDTVRREKYYVWKLLEYALLHSFGKPLDKLGIRKTEFGKWVCDKYAFSLSHSSGAVAVAVSCQNVGVDLEAKRDIREGIYSKILSKAERDEYFALDVREKNDWLLKKWTQKESVFKTLDIKSYVIADIKTDNVRSFCVKINDKEYYLSVCSEHINNVKLFENVDLREVL